MERGKIYSFVGPAGGGKSYAANEIIGESNYNEVPCISVDFSDGIREIISVMLSGKCVKLDINSEKYFNWKEENQTIKIPDGTLFCVNGRDMLKNLGEFLKERIGEEIWANWALNILMKKYYELDILSRNACNIIFGSLRFDVELKAILKCAEFTKKEVEEQSGVSRNVVSNIIDQLVELKIIEPDMTYAKKAFKYSRKS